MSNLEEQVIDMLKTPSRVPGFLLVMDVTAEDKDESFQRSLKLLIRAYDIKAPKEKNKTIYHAHLLDELREREFAIGYLQANLEEGYDPDAFRLAIRNIAEAHGVFNSH